MPRGQTAQPVQGGSLNPYVQQSLQAGKQQGENRLLSAMQESGATSRAQSQEAGATQRTSMQIQNQQAMQAAEAEQADKRAAENERARREEMQLRSSLQESSQRFQAEYQKADQEFETAKDERDYKRMNEAVDTMMGALAVQMYDDADQQETMKGTMVKLAKAGGNVETLKEKFQTSLLESEKQTLAAKGNYDRDKTRFAASAAEDPALNRPVGGVIETRPGKGRKIEMFGGGAGGMLPTTEEFTRPGSEPQVMDAWQRYMVGAGSKLKVDDLMPRNADKLTQAISKNEISAEDIRFAVGAMDGLTEDLARRASEAETPIEEEFWNRNYALIRRSRAGLMNLMHNDTNVGNTNEKVGGRIRTAFNPIEGIGDDGSKFIELKTQIGDAQKAYETILAEYLAPGAATKSLDRSRPGLLPYQNNPRVMGLVDMINDSRARAFENNVPELPKTSMLSGAFPGGR